MKQWGEIQARSRKMTYDEFLSLATQKRADLATVLHTLKESVPMSLQGVREMAEVLEEGALWFPGGSKEMRVSEEWGGL